MVALVAQDDTAIPDDESGEGCDCEEEGGEDAEKLGESSRIYGYFECAYYD